MTNQTYSFSEIWAKSNGKTLEQHTEECLFWLLKFLKWDEEKIHRASDVLKISDDEIISRLFATIYLHDIGKSTTSFQSKLRNEKKSSPPHALMSLPFVISACPPINEVYFESLAVISHHTSFYNELYSDYAVNFQEYYLLNFVNGFYHKLLAKHLQLLKRKYPFNLENPQFDISQNIVKGIHPYRSHSDIREPFSLFVSMLHLCDWLASSGIKDFQYGLSQIEESLTKHFKKNCADFQWKSFQEKAKNISTHIFIKIPTGQGKTEAALLWSSNNKKPSKIIYCLPTRVTSDKIYQRLQVYFGNNNVGLSHGTSALTIGEETSWEPKKYRSRLLYSSTLLLPVTVMTVDQLLLAQFNWNYWELIEHNASNSMIIFDEIHSYDFYTTALILCLIESLDKRGAKFCFMSATLPNYLQKAIKDYTGTKIQLIEDKSFNKLSRHQIIVTNKNIENDLEKIINAFKQNKKVLVILNTVSEAREIYQKLKNILERTISQENLKSRLLLFHGRFIERDRKVLSNRIQEGEKFPEGFLAVTTQVIEVSIDIDYDVLFTQLAPVDDLIQRFGRVNRKNEKGIADVFIYQPNGEKSNFIYGSKNLDRAEKIIAEFDTHILSEIDVKKMIKKQYPLKETKKILNDEYCKIRENLKILQSQLWHIQTLQLNEESQALTLLARTREGKRLTIEAIPNKFQNEVEKLLPLQRLNYFVRIPFFSYKKYLYRNEDKKIWYVDTEYSEELGLMEASNKCEIWD